MNILLRAVYDDDLSCAENTKDLLDEIESLRKKLETVILLKGSHTDPEVISVSRELDIAINKYYFLFG